MSNCVLIHRAYHGGWCWTRVAKFLRAAGHDVHTPTLAGMGEHAHLLSSQITLETHVEDVTNHIETEELTGVTLVGHSYGGMVITGAADRLDGSRRIARLIYVDALVPNDGDTWHSFSTPGAAATRYAQTADGLFMPHRTSPSPALSTRPTAPGAIAVCARIRMAATCRRSVCPISLPAAARRCCHACISIA